MDPILELLMDGDTTVGFLIIIAFLLGAGVQKLSSPNGTDLSRVLGLLEAVASYLGTDHHNTPDRRGEGTPDP